MANRFVLALFAVAWGGGIVVGSYALLEHSFVAGAQPKTGFIWPAIKDCPKPKGRTILLFAHPRCPCVWATLEELETVLATSKNNSAA